MNKKKWLTYILPTIFFLCFLAALVGTSLTRPRVLVVMSYSAQDLWEQQIRAALEQTFQKNAPFFLVDYDYLNISHNSTPDYIARVLQNVNTLITVWHPHVLLLVDDDAQFYVGKAYLNNPNISIVFSGVSEIPALYGYKPKENVTGILENLQFKPMQDAIKTMLPQYTKIIHLCDGSRISAIIGPQIASYDWRPLQFLGSYPVNSLTDWLKIVKMANADHAILLVTHLQAVFDRGRHVDPEKLMQLTLQQAQVPILGFFNFDADLGAPMTVSTSGFEQGQVAADMAIRILLKHEKPGDIPFANSQYFDFSINQKSIAINMPQVQIPFIYRSLAFLQTYFKTATQKGS